MMPAALRALTDLIYPPACLLCRKRPPSAERTRHAGMRVCAPLTVCGGRPADPNTGTAHLGQQALCPECLRAMPKSGRPVCRRCGIALRGAFDASAPCRSCAIRPLAFEMARAPWQYAGAAQQAVRQFKYHRRWRIGRWLADTMAHTALASMPLAEIAAVLPVPSHWLRRRLRGSSPAEDLAYAVSRLLDKPCRPGALRRARWTRRQTRLPWRRRFQNVRQAFEADPRLVSGEAFLLIDDVVTSGATADACALALKRAGARAVFVLAAARTPLE